MTQKNYGAQKDRDNGEKYLPQQRGNIQKWGNEELIQLVDCDLHCVNDTNHQSFIKAAMKDVERIRSILADSAGCRAERARSARVARRKRVF